MRYTRKITSTNYSNQQPAKCRGCIWGRLEGSRQFCSRIRCVKEGEKVQHEIIGVAGTKARANVGPGAAE